MRVSRTTKGNIKLVLSEDEACYIGLLTLRNDPKYDSPINDPWNKLNTFFDSEGIPYDVRGKLLLSE